MYNFRQTDQNCQPSRLVFTCFVSVLLLAGCGKSNPRETKRPDSERAFKVFGTLRDGDAASAIRVLEPISTSRDAHPFFEKALAREKERRTAARVNELLVEGRIRQAFDFYSRLPAGMKHSPSLVGLEAKLDALLALQQYASAMPFTDSGTAKKALEKLESQRSALSDIEAFNRYLREQSKAISEWREREGEILFDELLKRADIQTVSARKFSDDLSAQINLLRPANRFCRLAKDALSEEWRSFRTGLPVPPEQPADLREIEIICCRYWIRMPDEARELTAACISPHAPQSLSGMLLRALAASEKGGASEAIEWLKAVTSVAGIHSSYLEYLIKTGVLPPGQFSAGCWRTSAPGVTHLLDRVEQLREYR